MTHSIIRATAACAALAAVVVLFTFDPAATSWFPSCPFRALTGWLCPLCGTLRAVHAVLHGDPRAALALNPLMTLGVPVGLAAWVHDALRPAQESQFEILLRRSVSAPGLALLMAFSVLRNVPDPIGWFAR